MSKTLKEFQAWETEEGKNYGRTKCNICHKFLDALDEQEPYYFNKKRVCSDCYYEEFGKLIDEQSGIGVPHRAIRECNGNLD